MGWRVLREGTVRSEIEHGLIAHVAEQVEDAEVGLEAMPLPVDLIVGRGGEVGVGQRALRMDGLAEVGLGGNGGTASHSILRGGDDGGLEAQQLAHLAGDGHVEVEEELPLLGEEWLQVVGVELKERAFAVGRAECVPVLLAPLPVVAHAHFSHGCLVEPSTLGSLHGHGERLQAVGGGDDAAVSEGLLREVVVLLYVYRSVAVGLLPPLHGGEVGRGEQTGSPPPPVGTGGGGRVEFSETDVCRILGHVLSLR